MGIRLVDSRKVGSRYRVVGRKYLVGGKYPVRCRWYLSK